MFIIIKEQWCSGKCSLVGTLACPNGHTLSLSVVGEQGVPTQHGYKAQHSTVTALHMLNNTVAKGFNQMAPPARTITVVLDMSKAFDTVNTHTIIGKLLQTRNPCTILKFVANYIKGRKAYTSTYY